MSATQVEESDIETPAEVEVATLLGAINPDFSSTYAPIFVEHGFEARHSLQYITVLALTPITESSTTGCVRVATIIPCFLVALGTASTALLFAHCIALSQEQHCEHHAAAFADYCHAVLAAPK